jgi:hypothetical protein
MSKVGHNNPPADQNGGWVAIRRAMREHWLVGFGQPVTPCDPEKGAYSRAEAFIDLIMECRYEAGTVNNGGRKMRLERGQLLGAVSWLASRWNWTPKTVRGFLDKLEDDAMIERFSPGTQTELNGTELGKQKGKQASILTVCNYYAYQLVDYIKGQAPSLPEGTQRASKGQAEGNSTKDNKGTREQEKTISFASADDQRVTFEKGELQLFNGVRQFWLNEFGDEHALNLALKQAAGYVQINSHTRSIEAQVSSQLARMARDKRDKDARYAKAVKDNPKSGGSKRLSLDELSAGVDAAYERQFSNQPKPARLTHER